MYINRTTVSFEFIKKDEKIRAETNKSSEIDTARFLLIAFEAIGLLLFWGWRLSFSESIESLNIYPELEIKQKDKKAKAAGISFSELKSSPPKKIGKNTIRFLIQWFALNSFNIIVF